MHRLPGRPARQVFASVRLGALDHPSVRAFIGALAAVRTGWTRQRTWTVIAAAT